MQRFSPRLLKALAGQSCSQHLISYPAAQSLLNSWNPATERFFNSTSSIWQAQPKPEPEPERDSSEQAAGPGSTKPQPEASTASSPKAEEYAKKVLEDLKSGFDSAKTKFQQASGQSDSGSSGGAEASSSGGSSEEQQQATRSNMIESFMKEIRDVLLPNQNISSATKAYTGPVAEVQAGGYSGPAEIMLVQQEQTTWDKVKQKVASIPFLGKVFKVDVRGTSAYQKGQQLVDDLKEKYETSDHPVVHKVEEVKEKLFAGSESSRAMREIRTRHPGFDMIKFVQSIKVDAPAVTKAFLKHDLDTLKLHCGKDLLERFEGIFKHFKQQEVYEDPTILFVGDVEIVEVRQMEDDPFIIAQFHCQQLKCTRDKFGNVIEGSPDSIQRVYYFWGLQQEKQGVVTADGQLLPPRWVIKDMMWQSMLALV